VWPGNRPATPVFLLDDQLFQTWNSDTCSGL
jgi:hypothetical protein